MAPVVNVQADPSTAGTWTVFGDRKVAFATLVADDAYPAGGYTIDPRGDLSWDGEQIDWIVAQPAVGGSFYATYDPENVKVKIFAAAGTEISTNDAEDEEFPLLIIGK